MVNKYKSGRIPQYMTKFSCIGPTCEDSCCLGGWQIDIDHSTYMKLKSAPKTDIKELIDHQILRNETSSSNSCYGHIHSPEDRCPFLSEEKLCNIQLKLGEPFLSDVCSAYPRLTNIVNGMMERSATMSCPEIARIALLNPEGISFIPFENSQTIRHNMYKEIEQSKEIVDLREFTIKLLQTRMYTLDERLVILGIFCDEVQQLLKQKKPNQLSSLIHSYENWITNESLKKKLGQLPKQINLQFKILKLLIDYRITYEGLQSERYLSCYSEFIEGLQFSKDEEEEQFVTQYNESYLQYYQPFMKQHEFILENYLVNYVFREVFPSEIHDCFDQYVRLVLQYTIIKMHLIGIAAFNKGLNVELIIKLIQSYSKAVEQDFDYYDSICTALKKEGYNTMAYMAILIRS
jgi:lysine-N-methylase